MSDNTPLDRLRAQRMLEELESLQGRGTELVTVYIPPGKAVSEVMSYLRNELGTAVNIKSKTTRKNVQDAITKVMERLKLFREIPPTGLAIFAGTIASDQLGVGDMQTFVIVPPDPISIYYYRCEHQFMLDPLFNLLAAKDVYGLVVLDSKDATFATLKGNRTDIIKEYTSGVAGKTRAGGQSSRRYERLRDMFLNEWFVRLGNYFTEHFKDIPNLRGIVVGGPGPTKEDFLKGDFLHYELKDTILATVDTGYTGPEGIKEMVNRSRDIIKNARYYEERRVVQEFLRHIGEDDGLVTYGEQEVIQALKSVNVQTLLISEEVRRTIYKIKCKLCGFVENRIVDSDKIQEFESNLSNLKCLKCGGDVEVTEKEDLIEYLVKLADNAKAKIELVSKNTEEGDMLLNSFGGIAAITNYRQY
ncbi:peptide chain release factor aRF-1 [Candidatus Bathyarchaeota archaeon]|nr:peptide chain release factor aRF-1 [Candidatus Bathyarchaeota archaeon]